jgi:hypothetical protein
MMFWILLSTLLASVSLNLYFYNKLRVARRVVDSVAQLTASLLDLSNTASHGLENLGQIKRVDSFLEEN